MHHCGEYYEGDFSDHEPDSTYVCSTEHEDDYEENGYYYDIDRHISDSLKFSMAALQKLVKRKGLGRFISRSISRYAIIRSYMPHHYRSKSGYVVKNVPLGWCGTNEFLEEGFAENLSYHMQMQSLNALSSALSGSYPAACALMSEQLLIAYLAFLAVSNKKSLTGKDNDRDRAMSLYEFEHFLDENFDNASLSSMNKHELYMRDNTFLKICSDAGFGEELHKIYGQLRHRASSNRAPAMNLVDICEAQFVPGHHDDSFIDCIYHVLRAQSMIFRLLAVIAYYDLEHDSKYLAYEFSSNLMEALGHFGEKGTPAYSMISSLAKTLKKEEIDKDRDRIIYIWKHIQSKVCGLYGGQEEYDMWLKTTKIQGPNYDTCEECGKLMYGSPQCQSCLHDYYRERRSSDRFTNKPHTLPKNYDWNTLESFLAKEYGAILSKSNIKSNHN